jgi:hypothetical protein
MLDFANGGTLMNTNHPYNSENAAARAQLKAFIAGLTEAELSHPMEAGWTVAAVLGHLAFWDLRALTLIEKWQKNGIGPSPIDTDVVNEATRPLCLAIPARAAADVALSSAAAIDQVIDALNPEMIAEIETNGKTVLLNRGKHRRTHIADIAQALGK